MDEKLIKTKTKMNFKTKLTVGRMQLVQCKNLVSYKSFVSTNWHSNEHILCTTMCNKTMQIKLTTSADCCLYASYVTSCISSACRVMKQPSHYLVLVLASSMRYSYTSLLSDIWTHLVQAGFQKFESSSIPNYHRPIA